MGEETNKPKRQRALPRVWKPFHQLHRGEKFYVGKAIVVKNSFISGREIVQDACLAAPLPVGDVHFVWPWRRVKTTEYVRDSRPGGKSSADIVDNVAQAPVHVSRASILHRPHDPQPSSDNNITGPTS